jgi:hypothetical protein
LFEQADDFFIMAKLKQAGAEDVTDAWFGGPPALMLLLRSANLTAQQRTKARRQIAKRPRVGLPAGRLALRRPKIGETNPNPGLMRERNMKKQTHSARLGIRTAPI